ncbi:hypothetical protein [Nocardiopsis sp. RV163]|uniref:hypothetical protein n=1 Tax=Nocardiopsis sp. RV163 TaxID=1661388 RepID=UPI00064B8FC4|nr:hypothetical protein [Nocardiopsis sp. RV163]
MTSSKASTKVLAAASAAAVLSLTACSGGTAVYDFTEPVTEPTQSIGFRVPDELLELSDGYAENRVYESITVTSVESEDPSQCAVEYQFEYAEGGLDRLLAYVEETAERNSGTMEERIAGLLTGEPESSELSEDYSSAVVPMSCAVSPNDAENTVRVAFSQMIEDEPQTFARAEIAVMQGNELFVHEPEVNDGWQLDSNGSWIQAE